MKHLVEQMEVRHYPRAPITEALVDFRLQYENEVTLDQLKNFGIQLRGEYPYEANREMVQAQFIANPNAAPTSSSTRRTIGYIYHAPDRRQAVQIRVDGFTFSRFAPYETWDGLINETRRLWVKFAEAIKPTNITRLAVRYINQIDLPLTAAGTIVFEEYLATFPHVAIGSEQTIEQFMLRLVLPQSDLNAILVLTEALLPQQKPSKSSIILDIDLFRDGLTLSPGSDEIWSILTAFRSRKNQYFEASITDAARGLFR